MQAGPCLDTALCCSDHAFESIFSSQCRGEFLLEGSVSDPCYVLGDLLLISGSFLKLLLIYGSPCPFHTVQALKSCLTNLKYCWSKTDPKWQPFSVGAFQLCSKSC